MTSNLRVFKNRHLGQRCFLLGNGPSLKKTSLSKLSQEICFCVNWFPLTEESKLLETYYYCISDQHFWNYGKGLHDELIDIISNKNYHHLFIDYSAKQHIQDSIHSPRALTKISYLNYSRDLCMWNGHFESDIEHTLAWGRTVILDFCVPIAKYMGFSEIYLVGCDCDYNLDKKSDFSESYFYSSRILPQKDIEHLEHQRDVRGSFNKQVEWFASYKTAWKNLSANGIIFKNATIGGRLETIPRVDFDSLF